ncbi:uncharacterized protein BDW43DRAFT_294515 [Aspergillus alliaceus]|uniref:uncharacterized protein n=1 Tax=Petromyces alliaceus TaxID=209559 RepID=UPI0012A6B503|nr:uncharacterized protein BDW43DRAFT_294515 [Aspergillus alliaceus]KAB8227282.1 hypothetical protein BDW43DRAFT_294515 [Aspergillus alliaceus]
MDKMEDFQSLFMSCGQMMFPKRLVLQGSEGEVISTVFQSAQDILTQPFLSFKVAFGWKLTEAVFQPVGYWGPYYQYNLVTTVPSVAETGFTSSDMPFSVVVEGYQGILCQTLQIGVFRYNLDVTSSFLGVQAIFGKLGNKDSVKRHAEECPHDLERYPGTKALYRAVYRPPIPPLSTTDPVTISGRECLPIVQAWLEESMALGNDAQEHLETESLKLTGRSEDGFMGVDGCQIASRPNNVAGLQVSDSATSTNKADRKRAKRTGRPTRSIPRSVIIDGISSMTRDWSANEINYSRRVVYVSEVVQENTRKVVLSPITQDKWRPNTKCISCIYWREQHEHYITSVDVLLLLEVVSGLSFAAADRIRIRRTLERFKPITINRKERDSWTDEISRLILNLPAPKPMIIQKSTKIFKWRTLETILSRVVG